MSTGKARYYRRVILGHADMIMTYYEGDPPITWEEVLTDMCKYDHPAGLLLHANGEVQICFAPHATARDRTGVLASIASWATCPIDYAKVEELDCGDSISVYEADRQARAAKAKEAQV